MKPPADLDAESKALWTRCHTQLTEQGTWKDADAEFLEAYVRNRQTARLAHEAAAAEPFVKGSTGQIVAHPGRKVAREAELDALRNAEALLLTAQKRPAQKDEGEDLTDLGLS